MENNNSTDTIDLLIQKVKDLRYGDIGQKKEAAEQLLKVAEKEEHIYGKAVAYTYIADASYDYGEYLKTIHYGMKAIEIAEHHHYADLLVQAYNLIGIGYGELNENHYAVSYYLKGKRVAEKNNDFYSIAMFLNNISALYIGCKGYKKAVEFLKRAEKIARRQKKEENRCFPLAMIYYNLATMYIKLKDTKTAKVYLEKGRKEAGAQQERIFDVNYRTMMAQIAACEGDLEKVYEYAVPVDENLDIEQLFLRVPVYIDNIKLFLEIKDYKRAGAYLNDCYSAVKQVDVNENWIPYLELYIQYCRESGDNTHLLWALNKYYDCMKEEKEASDSVRVYSIDNTIEMDRIEEEREHMQEKNQYLLRVSQLDALTGVANRFAMNAFLKKNFIKAKENHSYLGIIMIDIDYFKQYNDTYGHVAGDQCICSVATILENEAGKDGMVCRCGGDEFVVIFVDKSTEIINQCAQRIKASLNNKEIPHKASKISEYVTISQGIINIIPEEESSINDFIDQADKCLYQAKKTHRGKICIRGQVLE